jgi:gamma-glutamyltranspeptidase/glutathione hydrolase
VSVSKPQINTGRSTVYTNGGVVASISPLAASAGVRVLADGGNAFDAAIATAAVEAVTVSAGCGLGGEPFVIMYEAKTGRVYGLNGSGKAPMAATRDYFVDKGYSKMPLTGPLAAAIPGEVAGWEDILARFGTVPMAKLLESAIGYAENGHAISARTARGFQMMHDKLSQFPDSVAVFTKDGAPLQENDILVQKNLANTLRRVAEGGADEFYRGDTAKEMVRAIQAAGGLYTEEEFAQHESSWYEPPISSTYRDYTVYETSPPSQGFLLLEMLNIMEGLDIGEMGFNSAETVHAMVQAKKLAMADRNEYMGDPEYIDNPLDELISKPWAAQRRALMNPAADINFEPGPLAAPIAGDDNTSYFCVVDKEGNAVSFIHSLSMGFGGGFVAGETGVTLNNRVGRGFSLVDGHPNVIEPGKRTMHTLNAYMVFKDDKPYIVGATPGGDRQIAWNAQVISNVIDHGMNPQQAVEAPRWTSLPGTDPASVDDPFVLEIEEGIADSELAKLKAKGHNIELKPVVGYGGSVKLIVIDPETGVRMGASDPRSDGHAAVV